MNVPGTGQGYARCASEARNRGLWGQLTRYYCSHIGPQGTVLHELVKGARNGAVTNAALTTFWSQTAYGWGMTFDGSNDLVNLGASATDPVGTGPVTIACRVYLTGWGGGSSGRFFDNGKCSLGGTGTTTGNLFFTSDGVTNCVTPNNSISLNTWYHVVAVRSVAGTGTFYVNGRTLGTVGQSMGTATAGSAAVTAGNLSSGIRGMAGTMVDLGIWGRVLTPQEILQLYRDPWALTRIGD